MHKTFISYHHENEEDLKERIVEKFGGEDFIDKSIEDGDIDPNNSEDTIMRTIRDNFLLDSTVTLVLIGEKTAERPFVNSEIQASLWSDNPNGLLAVIRDNIYNLIFEDSVCNDPRCNCGIKLRGTTYYYNKLLPFLVYKNHYKENVPHWEDEDVYCSVISFSTFINSPEYYIEQVFNKREHAQEFEIVKRNPQYIPKI